MNQVVVSLQELQAEAETTNTSKMTSQVRGRMDMHIELSYCSFEGFKMLAVNYLSFESHLLVDTILRLLRD
jgi:hypothetical protein